MFLQMHSSNVELTFHWLLAKFFWICADTEPWMFLSKAAPPDILPSQNINVERLL